MWESWVIALSIGIVALAFVALVVFLIMTLVSLRETLKTTNEMCADLEQKIHAFDPVVRVVSEVGSTVEKCVHKIKHAADESQPCPCCHPNHGKVESRVNTVLEVAEWAVVGLALWQKIKERR